MSESSPYIPHFSFTGSVIECTERRVTLRNEASGQALEAITLSYGPSHGFCEHPFATLHAQEQLVATRVAYRQDVADASNYELEILSGPLAGTRRIEGKGVSEIMHRPHTFMKRQSTE